MSRNSIIGVGAVVAYALGAFLALDGRGDLTGSLVVLLTATGWLVGAGTVASFRHRLFGEARSGRRTGWLGPLGAAFGIAAAHSVGSGATQAILMGLAVGAITAIFYFSPGFLR